MSSESDWFDGVLLEYCVKHGMASVKIESSESAVGLGANFTTDIIRVQLCLEGKDGKIRKMSVVVKKNVPSLVENTMMREMDIFKTEIEMYTKIFPLMQELLDGEEPLWPHYLGHRNFDRIVLEDLREKEFQMVGKIKGMDLNHCLLAVRGLARFHALSLALINKDLCDMKLSPQYIFGGGIEMSNQYIVTCVEASSQVTAADWPKELNYYKVALEKLSSVIIEELNYVCNKYEPKLKVLNHGDLWVNNMLFQYNKSTKKPQAIRYVDYQMSNYGSYAVDLQYFMGTSLDVEVRAKHMDVLVVEYQMAFEEALKKYGFLDLAPTLEEVKEELARTEIVFLMASLAILPLILNEGKYSPRKDSDISWELRLKRVKKRYDNKNYSTILQKILQRVKDSGFLDKLFSRYNV